MELNTSFTGVPIFDMTVQQSYSSLLVLNHLICSNPDIIKVLEVGTARGGLSVFFALSMLLRKGTVFTFDILLPQDILYHKYFAHFNINYFNDDIFSATSKEICQDFLAAGRCLIFCDGGSKEDEFPYFVDMAKPGDIIVSHDCGTEFLPERIPFSILDKTKPLYPGINDVSKTLLYIVSKV